MRYAPTKFCGLYRKNDRLRKFPDVSDVVIKLIRAVLGVKVNSLGCFLILPQSLSQN